MPIKKIAKELHISIQTSFDWRHKILSSLDQFVPTESSEEVACDELELPFSNKGSRSLERKPRKRGTDFKRNQGKGKVTTVQIVTAIQRNGDTYLKAVIKRLSKEEIAKVFDGKLAEIQHLLQISIHLNKVFTKDNPTIKHKVLLAKDHVDKMIEQSIYKK